MMSEDEILEAFGVYDELETSRELAACQRRVRELENRLRDRPPAVATPPYVSDKTAALREKAEKYERLYAAVLARNEILNRKVRELGG